MTKPTRQVVIKSLEELYSATGDDRDARALGMLRGKRGGRPGEIVDPAQLL